MIEFTGNGSETSDWSKISESMEQYALYLDKKKDKKDSKTKNKCCEKWKKGKRCKNCPLR